MAEKPRDEGEARVGDRVYSISRLENNKQPNGVIVNIFWPEKEVIVEYYSDPWHGEKEFVSLQLVDFQGTWVNRFGGGWHVD